MKTRRSFAIWAARLEGLLWQALFPRRCPYCGEIAAPAGYLICPYCEARLPYIRGQRCDICGKQLQQQEQPSGQPYAAGGGSGTHGKTPAIMQSAGIDSSDFSGRPQGTARTAAALFAPSAPFLLCKNCAKHRRSFQFSLSLLNYDGISAEIMAGLKYLHKKEYADALAWLLFRNLGGTLRKLGTAALVPVPVHAKRRRERGYNQAEALCRSLCAFMNCDEAALLRMGLSDEMLRRVRIICREQTGTGGKEKAGKTVAEGMAAYQTATDKMAADRMTAGWRSADHMRTGRMTTVNLLVRTKNTKAQKGLGAAERLLNLQKAFSLSPQYRKRLPQSVLLVDDIYTTGATMEACTQVLLSAGVRKVYGLCVCAGRDV